jgi:hypothetical protein
VNNLKYKNSSVLYRGTKLNKKQTQTFLFSAQSVGTVFVIIFLAAYFGGLPSTETLNSEPAFIISQSIVGALFIIFVISALVIVTITKSKTQ